MRDYIQVEHPDHGHLGMRLENLANDTKQDLRDIAEQLEQHERTITARMEHEVGRSTSAPGWSTR